MWMIKVKDYRINISVQLNELTLIATTSQSFFFTGREGEEGESIICKLTTLGSKK